MVLWGSGRGKIDLGKFGNEVPAPEDDGSLFWGGGGFYALGAYVMSGRQGLAKK